MDVNDSNVLWKLATGLLSVLLGVVGWGAVRVFNKLDKTEEELSKCVTREELAELMRDFRESNTSQHKLVSDTLIKLNERVDNIWEHLAK